MRISATRVVFALFAATLLHTTSARAEGFITPFLGYNFGGSSGNCPSLTSCQEKHTNLGVSIGTTGAVIGIEEDLSFAKGFFGESAGVDNSVSSFMSNMLVSLRVGPVRPYVVGGFGVIRPHVSSFGLTSDKNALGYDLGGGVTVSLVKHLGLRGDIRHFHTIQNVDVLVFTGERLDFLRASAGLVLKF